MENMDNNKISDDQTANDSDVSPQERELLDDSMENSLSEDNINLKHSELDNTDDDGELLNVSSLNNDDAPGADLDVPGAELDDEDEETGNEDEENNSWSQADTD